LSQAEQHFLAKHKIPKQQPLYLPDLALCNFFFNLSRKNLQKPRRIEDAEIIKQNTKQQRMSISKTDFHKCLEQWETGWNKCIN
jgi:hypothetical protein